MNIFLNWELVESLEGKVLKGKGVVEYGQQLYFLVILISMQNNAQ